MKKNKTRQGIEDIDIEQNLLNHSPAHQSMKIHIYLASHFLYAGGLQKQIGLASCDRSYWMAPPPMPGCASHGRKYACHEQPISNNYSNCSRGNWGSVELLTLSMLCTIVLFMLKDIHEDCPVGVAERELPTQSCKIPPVKTQSGGKLSIHAQSGGMPSGYGLSDRMLPDNPESCKMLSVITESGGVGR